jgi:hypothetical protein
MKLTRLLIVASSLGALLAACSGATTSGPNPTNDAGVEGGGGGPDGGGASDSGSAGDGGGGGGGEAGASDGGACPQYTMSDKTCMTPADCTTVAKGCYCGSQPVIGISKSISTLAASCEAENAKTCALGCANFPGQQAEDGNTTNDGGTIAVLCDNMQCHTVVQ